MHTSRQKRVYSDWDVIVGSQSSIFICADLCSLGCQLPTVVVLTLISTIQGMWSCNLPNKFTQVATTVVVLTLTLYDLRGMSCNLPNKFIQVANNFVLVIFNYFNQSKWLFYALFNELAAYYAAQLAMKQQMKTIKNDNCFQQKFC